MMTACEEVREGYGVGSSFAGPFHILVSSVEPGMGGPAVADLHRACAIS